MIPLAFTLSLLFCGQNTGCTEIQLPGRYSHIDCLIQGHERQVEREADKFVCRLELGDGA